jgi:hypothetical protein
MVRKGMGKGKGRGYKNLMGKDPRVHSDSAKGRKQPQKLTFAQRFIPAFRPTAPRKPIPDKYKNIVAKYEPTVKKWGWKRIYSSSTGDFQGYVDPNGNSTAIQSVPKVVESLKKEGRTKSPDRFI